MGGWCDEMSGLGVSEALKWSADLVFLTFFFFFFKAFSGSLEAEGETTVVAGSTIFLLWRQ